MKLYSEDDNYKLYEGSMLDLLQVIKPNSIDSIVTDPPYGLTSITKRFGKENSAPAQFGKDGAFSRLSKGFMGKEWDGSGIEYNIDAWKACYEALKPGGYLLAFGGSRTFYRIACAIEEAGFEIRDTIMWLYGSGFPKSMNIAKGIEAHEKLGNAGTRAKRMIEQNCEGDSFIVKQTNNGAMGEVVEQVRKEYKPGTEAAKQWEGWGTCLKPAYEPIIVARKPCEGSVVENVLKYGVGGINLGECRVGSEDRTYKGAGGSDITVAKGSIGNGSGKDLEFSVNGRFPANVILTYDDTDFDEVCGGMPNTKSTYNENGHHEENIHRENQGTLSYGYKQRIDSGFNDEGSAARYFYCAKASAKDREEGCEKLADGLLRRMRADADDNNPTGLNKEGRFAPVVRKNTHPTVKPTELMQYLVRLVTPKGGTVLDPFNGSGSTGKAVMFENKERNANYKYVGIELTPEYLPITKARIEYVINNDFIFYKDENGNTEHKAVDKTKRTLFNCLEE